MTLRLSTADAKRLGLSLADRIDGVRTAKHAARPQRKRKGLAVATAAPVTWRIEFTVPVRVVSEANARSYWPERWKRFQSHKRAVVEVVVQSGVGVGHWRPVEWPVTVTLTRLGGKRMDQDNLSGSFKGIQDAVAEYVLGCDDGDEAKVSWQYRQEPAKVEAVRVEIAGGA